MVNAIVWSRLTPKTNIQNVETMQIQLKCVINFLPFDKCVIVMIMGNVKNAEKLKHSKTISASTELENVSLLF